MLDGKCVFVDDDGNPLEMFYQSGDHDSEDEVASDDNEVASFLALNPSKVGYGCQGSLCLRGMKMSRLEIKVNKAVKGEGGNGSGWVFL
nr:hypothetical protein [Tanacetum cinerariifolium]